MIPHVHITIIASYVTEQRNYRYEILDFRPIPVFRPLVFSNNQLYPNICKTTKETQIVLKFDAETNFYISRGRK